MINPLYAGIGGAVAFSVYSLAVYTWGHGNGKDAERLIWETANVETLTNANDGLNDTIEQLKADAARKDEVNTNATEQISTGQTQIIERIREVPVERVVTISGNCDDARINYGTVSLRNGWATGNRSPESTSLDSAPDISGGILGAVSRDTLNDQP